MKLLLINPNTTQSMTELMLAEARKIVSPQTELTGVTGRFGGRYVASRATYAIAGHAALEAYAEHGRSADVVVLACFGDPALLALKDVAAQPVVPGAGPGPPSHVSRHSPLSGIGRLSGPWLVRSSTPCSTVPARRSSRSRK